MLHSDASIHDVPSLANSKSVAGHNTSPLTLAEEAMIDAQITVDLAIGRLTRSDTPREFVAAIVTLRRDLRTTTAAIAHAPRVRRPYRRVA